MIKIISFDIGGTLLYSKSINNYNLKKLTDLIGKPYDEVRFAYKNVFQKNKGTLIELVTKFCNILNININENIINFFKEKFKDENNISMIDENVFNLFKDLKDMGYKIILFSNSCCLLKNNFEQSILENIDYIFYSYEIGYTKDEEESYKMVEKTMNHLPNEFLHIGDTLKSDYIKPLENGWNALYYGKIEDDSIDNIEKLEEIKEKISGDLWKKNLLRKKKD